MTLTVGMVTIDCANPQHLAEFYSQALDLQVLGDFGEFVFLGREDTPINIGLQKVPEPRAGKNRLHLDLRGEPRHPAADRMVALGATIQGEHSAPGLAWIVLADPEGNEFCIGEHTAPGDRPVGTSSAEWDERYASVHQVWSGEPNGALVAEVARLAPGRALDVGCGEGADALWLAAKGWHVTALDVSQVALERAALRAEQSGVDVHWQHAGLLDATLPAAAFDLVSALYPALLRSPGDEAERALLSAVAPGGTLLVVHHAGIDTEQARAAGFDPADYVSPADVARLLDAGWHVEVDEQRSRHVASGAGAQHTADVVLRARRLP